MRKNQTQAQIRKTIFTDEQLSENLGLSESIQFHNLKNGIK